MTNNGIEMLRQLADDLEEEARQVERLDREADELRRENAKLREIIDAMKADAALGRAVRRMPAWTFIYRNSVGWFCGTEMSQGTRTYGPKADTPEAALKAAGLTEVEN